MGICFSLCEKNTSKNEVVIKIRPCRKKPPSINFVPNRPRTTRLVKMALSN